MKHYFTLFFKVLLVIILLLSLQFAYNYVILKQKDFGIFYIYKYCQNEGIYLNHLRMAEDSGWSFYDKTNNEIGTCPGFSPPGDYRDKLEASCHRMHESAGKCTQKGFDTSYGEPLFYILYWTVYKTTGNKIQIY